jgi:hypothetical protein
MFNGVDRPEKVLCVVGPTEPLPKGDRGMKFKILGMLGFGILIGVLATVVTTRSMSAVQAQGPPGKGRIEYKVVFSPIGYAEMIQKVDGQEKKVVLGTKDPAEDMTKQFNALAAEGWEYVGPIASKERSSFMPGASGPPYDVHGMLILFKRTAR